MIRISRLTDYGLLILTHFAAHRGEPVQNARALSEETDIPLPTVSKLLKTMTRAGFLVSHRGAQGGYRLARPPEDITVAEIIETLEGPVAFTQCSDGPGQCEIEDGCRSRSNMQKINRAIKGALTGIRLADLTRPLPAELLTIGSAVPVSPASRSPARRETA